MSSRWLNRLLILNIIVQAGIIVTGAVVRVTASGLGCPTWPQCAPGSYTPTAHQPQSWHKYVEFGNRMLTFVLVIVAAATVIAVWRHTKERRLRALAATPVIGTFGQAILGGLTVLTGLNPVLVMSHFVLSIIIVWFCIRLWWLMHYSETESTPLRRALARVVTWVAFVIIVLGTVVTGTGPHSGDAEVEARFPFDPRVTAWIHADAVWLFIGCIVALWILNAAHQLPRSVNRWLVIVTMVTVAQGIIGYVQHFTGLPAGLVALHVLGSAVLWVTAVMLGRHIRYAVSE